MSGRSGASVPRTDNPLLRRTRGGIKSRWNRNHVRIKSKRPSPCMAYARRRIDRARMGNDILCAPFRLGRRRKGRPQAEWNRNVEMAMITLPCRSVFCSHGTTVFRLCRILGCEVESHFRGRTSYCRDEHRVHVVHVLNGTDLFLAYLFLSVVAGFMETLGSETIRRLKTGGVNGEKTSNKCDLLLTAHCVMFNVVA